MGNNIFENLRSNPEYQSLLGIPQLQTLNPEDFKPRIIKPNSADLTLASPSIEAPANVPPESLEPTPAEVPPEPNLESLRGYKDPMAQLPNADVLRQYVSGLTPELAQSIDTLTQLQKSRAEQDQTIDYANPLANLADFVTTGKLGSRGIKGPESAIETLAALEKTKQGAIGEKVNLMSKLMGSALGSPKKDQKFLFSKLTEAKKAFDRDVKPETDAWRLSDLIFSELDKGGKAARGVVKTQLLKLSSNVGSASDFEQKMLAIDPTFVGSAKQWINMKFSGDEPFTQDELNNLVDLVTSIKGGLKRNYQAKLSNHVGTFTNSVNDVLQYDYTPDEFYNNFSVTGLPDTNPGVEEELRKKAGGEEQKKPAKKTPEREAYNKKIEEYRKKYGKDPEL